MSNANEPESQEYNGWCIRTGADFRQRIRLSDPTQPNPDYPATSKFKYLPKPLDAFTFQMDIRTRNSKDAPLVISLTNANGGIIQALDADADAGFLTFFIDDTVTVDDTNPESIANQDKVFFDLFQIPTTPGADREFLFNGKIEVKHTITDVQ